MNGIAKRGSRGSLFLSAAVAVLLATIAGAASAAKSEARDELTRDLDEVNSFSLYGGSRGFRVLDRDLLIVWASRSRPYLIELAAPSFDLRFVHAIGIRSRTNRVYAGFDSVIVDGLRYPIRRIYRLDRDEAKSLDVDPSDDSASHEETVSG